MDRPINEARGRANIPLYSATAVRLPKHSGPRHSTRCNPPGLSTALTRLRSCEPRTARSPYRCQTPGSHRVGLRRWRPRHALYDCCLSSVGAGMPAIPTSEQKSTARHEYHTMRARRNTRGHSLTYSSWVQQLNNRSFGVQSGTQGLLRSTPHEGHCQAFCKKPGKERDALASTRHASFPWRARPGCH